MSHLMSSQLAQLQAAVTTYGVTVPPGLAERLDAAADLVREAEAALATITAESAPSIDGVTAATVQDRIAAAAAWQTHDVRARTAQAILDLALADLDAARLGLQAVAMTGLAAPFAKAAADLTTALAAIGGDVTPRARTGDDADNFAAYLEAARTLGSLARLRDMLAAAMPAPGPWYQPVEANTRVLSVDSVRTSQRIDNIPAARYEPAWWAAVADLPGVAIEWHEPAEQQRRFHNVPSAPPRPTMVPA